MRIGINALYALPGGVGGTEIYLRGLMTGFAEIGGKHDFIVFTNQESGTGLTPSAPNFITVTQPIRAAFRPLRLLWEQTVLPAAAVRHRVDVLLNPGFTGPCLCPCATVTTFHDLQHKRYPQYFRWWDLPFWRFFLFLSAVTSDDLIAVSEATRRDLLTFYPVPSRRISVVPQGAGDEISALRQSRQPDLANPFLLCVSTVHPHKNLDRLVRAFARFHNEHRGYRLVIAGMKGFFTERLEQEIRSQALDNAVTLTGWIPRSDLLELFRTAHASIQPSLFEGFGIPVAEALAAGIPMACSRIEPLSEIAGDAAFQFDPLDEDAICDAIRRIALDEPLRRRLAEAGPMRVREYTWTRTAQMTLQVLERAAQRSRSSS